MFTAHLSVPVDQHVHRVGLFDQLGLTMNLYELGAAVLFAEDQHRHARVAPKVFELVRAAARSNDHSAFVIDTRRNKSHLWPAVLLPDSDTGAMICLQEFPCVLDLHSSNSPFQEVLNRDRLCPRFCRQSTFSQAPAHKHRLAAVIRTSPGADRKSEYV